MGESPAVTIATEFGRGVLHLHGEGAAYFETEKDGAGNPVPWTVNRIPFKAWAHLEHKEARQNVDGEDLPSPWDCTPNGFTVYRLDRSFPSRDDVSWSAYRKIRAAILGAVNTWAKSGKGAEVGAAAEAARLEREAARADQEAAEHEDKAREFRTKAAALRDQRAALNVPPGWTAEQVKE